MDIDRCKFGPPDDTPMLPWFNGAFSYGFLALHPFVAIEGLHPGSCEYGTLILPRSRAPLDADLMEWVDEEAEQRRYGKEITESAVDKFAIKFGRVVRWREICELVGLADHCALDQALRTTILGLREDLEDQASAGRLLSYCDQNAIFRPTEGRLQPVMQAKFIEMFRRARVPEVIVGDEFGDDERLVSLGELDGDEAWDRRQDLLPWGIRRISAPDHSLFVWVHWDSFYTAIFATAERLEGCKLSELFEGFWCSDETTTYWLTQPAIPLTQ